MRTREMLFVTGLYLVALIAVIYFTRATTRRVAGAFIGGLGASLLGMGAIALCEAIGWWHLPFAPTPYFLPSFATRSKISTEFSAALELVSAGMYR